MYCTIQNIKELIPSNLLESLTSGNDAAIAKAIETAEATIGAYVLGAYEPQNASGSRFLQSVAEKLTVYNLYLVSAYDETPQIVITSYLEAISDLEKLQKGLISLADPQDAASERQAEVFTNKDALDRLFPKDGFRGF